MKCGLVCLAGVVVAVVAGACEVPPPTAIAPNAGNEVAAAARTDEKAREPGFQMPGVDGDRLLIRGANRLPSLSLSAEDVAANPFVLVDGVLVKGGLNELLAGEPLDIRGIGYSSAPGSFGDFGDESGRGIVLISTVGETAGSGVEWMLSGQEVRERVRAALERGREAAERGREAAQRGREAAQRGREAAERGREAAERGMKAAERGREALERSKDSWDHQRDAWQHDPATAEAAGWVIIRNVQGRPVLWLSPGSAATNPPVVIDGVVLEGGLDALSSLEPLDIVRLGYLGSKRGVFITTRR